METTLYYTFSTISQTLAGVIGLLAVFMIYHLTQLDSKLRSFLEVLFSRYPLATETVDLEFLWTNYDIPGLLKYFEEDKLHQLSGGEGLDQEQYLRPAKSLFKRRKTLVSLMRIGLWWTGTTILGAVVVLCFTTPVAAAGKCIVALTLSLGVVAMVGCLILCGRIVLGAIEL